MKILKPMKKVSYVSLLVTAITLTSLVIPTGIQLGTANVGDTSDFAPNRLGRSPVVSGDDLQYFAYQFPTFNNYLGLNNLEAQRILVDNNSYSDGTGLSNHSGDERQFLSARVDRLDVPVAGDPFRSSLTPVDDAFDPADNDNVGPGQRDLEFAHDNSVISAATNNDANTDNIVDNKQVRFYLYVHNNGAPPGSPNGGANGIRATNTRVNVQIPNTFQVSPEIRGTISADNVTYYPNMGADNATIQSQTALSTKTVNDSVVVHVTSNGAFSGSESRIRLLPVTNSVQFLEHNTTVVPATNEFDFNAPRNLPTTNGTAHDSFFNPTGADDLNKGMPLTSSQGGVVITPQGTIIGCFQNSGYITFLANIEIEPVAAEPRLSVSKLVRSVSPSPQAFDYSGSPYAPISTTIGGNGNGEVEFEVLLQNTGNVDLDNVNFADVLPPELTPKQGILPAGFVEGSADICTNLAEAQNPSSAFCVPAITPLPLNTSSGNRIILSSNDLGIGNTGFTAPLQHGATNTDGEVVRIRWRMTNVCSSATTLPTAHNYGLVSGRNNTTNATVTMLGGLTQFTPSPTATSYNISPTQWGTLFPGGAPLDIRQATNDVTVDLNGCNPNVPGITIGKFVRRMTPVPTESFFPTPGTTMGGRTTTTITGTAGGEVQYEVLIQNTGTGSINTVNFGDSLPTQLTFVAGSVATERCTTLTDATTEASCGPTNGSSAAPVAGILYIDTTLMGDGGVNSSTPLLPGEVIRIRWRMTSVCAPQQAPPALNYAMAMASTSTGSTALTVIPAAIQVFAGLSPHIAPFVPSEADMRDNFDQPNGIVGPTNDTFVTINPCSPPPPPGPKKYASLIPHPVGTSFPVPTSFADAQTTATAVDFGVRTAPYTAFFRVTLTNTGTSALSNVMMDDEFHLRNGAPVTPQSVVEPVSSQLDSFDVVAGTETALSPSTIKVEYQGASPTTANGLRFRVPRILPGQTIAFYYSIVVDPTVASPARPTGIEFHRNIVRVCFPQTTPTGVCTDGGSDDAFISDRTPPPTNQVITIIKTVNGQDADTDATAVSVANAAGLSYVVTVTAPATNTAPVTGIRITDTVTTLPNVTGITNIRLVTPAGPCIAPAGCTITTIQTDLPTRTFDLAPGQSAVLTYQATATNTGTSTSAFNRNTATATPNNAPPVSNPATIVVPGNRTPDTDFKIEKKVNPQVVRDGDEIEYTITVEPDGDNDEIADLVLLITDDINDDGTLSQGGVTITYIRNSTDIETDDADCEGEMDDEDGIRCEDVGPDEEIEITYKARVSVRNLICPETVTVDNTAQLRDDTPNVDIRDEDDAEVRTICTPPPNDRPLTIEKNVDRHEVRRGEIANYTIIVSNPNPTITTNRLVDTIGLNNGTVPGQNGGRVRFIPGSLQISGAGFTGSIDNPEGVVLTIPGNGQAILHYQASGEPEANQTMISLAPNTATLDTGAYATAFVQLPTTGPEAAAAVGLISAIGAYIATRKRKQ